MMVVTEEENRVPSLVSGIEIERVENTEVCSLGRERNQIQARSGGQLLNQSFISANLGARNSELPGIAAEINLSVPIEDNQVA
jgi:hypothetical protein